ncbi:unnamed protein product [Dovyalis caffra]|uniref:Disease resistance N-terminal domain-containing protein n=1 Tax=Dovyalis caffra TaxID=77055 RepID=A0AAV1QV22_9ROSI|nr:unnamed protein product [Dovyalis caffra]
MAESAVSFAIDKLVPLLTEEVTLLKGIHEEVVVIKDDLEAIKAFLKDADSKAKKEGINEGVKVWVKQAREVAYQIEDVIDEYMLHVAQHHERRGCVGFVHRIASLVIKLQPRHEIASEIQDNLEFLDVRESLVRELPIEINRFFKLRYLFGHPGLKQLRRLWITDLKKRYGRDLCTAVERLTQLRAPYVSIINESDILEMQSMDDPIKVLQALPNLKYLVLIFGYNGEKVHFEEGGFQKLKELSLTGLNELKTMTIDKGAMPLLESLAIGPCPLLKEVPSRIQHLKHQKELYFDGMSNEFTQRLSREQGEAIG